MQRLMVLPCPNGIRDLYHESRRTHAGGGPTILCQYHISPTCSLTDMAEVERMDNHDPCVFFLPSFTMAHVTSGQILLTGIWLIPNARKMTSPVGRMDAGVC